MFNFYEKFYFFYKTIITTIYDKEPKLAPTS